MLTNFSQGASYLGKGFRLLSKPGIRLFVIIPIIINVIIFSLLIALGIHYFGGLVHWLNGFIPSWLHWLDWLLWIVFSVSILFFATFSFTLIANLIAAPFNGLLAEKIQLQLTSNKPKEQALLTLIPRAIGRQCRLLLYNLPRMLGLLILFMIPVINLIAPIAWFFFNSWMMSLQYLDYPMDNNQISFKQMRDDMRKTRGHCFGFGSLIQCLTMLPLINLVIMPAAVAGATVMWVEVYKSNKFTQ